MQCLNNRQNTVERGKESENQRKQQRKTTAKKTKKKTNALNTKKPAKKINKRGKNTGQKNKIYFRVSLRAQAVACARNKAQQAFLPAQRPPSESLFFFVPRKRPPRGIKLVNENVGFKRFPDPGAIPLVEKFTNRFVVSPGMTST